jgi:hypothetical protein
VPYTVTSVPIGPEVGENEVIVGASLIVVTVKTWSLLIWIVAVITVILPVLAPAGTFVEIVVMF